MASIGGSYHRDQAEERMRERARRAIAHSPHAEAVQKQRREEEAQQANEARKARRVERRALRQREEERAEAMGDEDFSSFLPQVPGPHGEGAEYIEEEKSRQREDRLAAQRERFYPDWGPPSPFAKSDVWRGAGHSVRAREREKKELEETSRFKELIFGSDTEKAQTTPVPEGQGERYGPRDLPPHPVWAEYLGEWYDLFSRKLGRNVLNLPDEYQMELLAELEDAEDRLLSRMELRPTVPISGAGKPPGVFRTFARKVGPRHRPAETLLREWEEGEPEKFEAYLKELARVRAYRQALLDQVPVQIQREHEEERGGERGIKRNVERALILQLAEAGRAPDNLRNPWEK